MRVPVEEARRRYGGRLLVGSHGIVVKKRDDEGNETYHISLC